MTDQDLPVGPDSEDYKLIQERLGELFTAEDLDQSGWAEYLASVGPDQSFRRQLAQIDLEFFFRYYLRHHFTLPFAELHYSLIGSLVDLLNDPGDQRGLVAVPRGFGKTTIVTLAMPLWASVHSMRKYITIVSDSAPGAREQLGNIKIELENNPRILADYGAQRGSTWAADLIALTNGTMIRALGAGQKIRGRKWRQFRPDLLLFDDIEDLEQVYSPTQREARKRWFYGSAVRARGADAKILVVGNILHNDSLIAELLNNPFYKVRRNKALKKYPTHMTLWDSWETILLNRGNPNRLEDAEVFFKANKDEMLLGAESSWPELHSVYDLMVTRATDGHAAFARELQNDPSEVGKELFKKFSHYRLALQPSTPTGSTSSTSVPASATNELWLVPLDGAGGGIDVPLSKCQLFAFTDPALGLSRTADYTAIIILARTPQGYLYVLEADIERRTPSQAQNRQVELASKWPLRRWGIESVAFQALYYTESAERLRKAGISVPLVPVSQRTNKQLRIEALEPDINNGMILFKREGQELLLQQLRDYGTTTYDDGPDALEGCRTLALQWRDTEEIPAASAETFSFDEQHPQPIPAAALLGSQSDLEVITAIEETIADLRARKAPKTQIDLLAQQLEVEKKTVEPWVPWTKL